MALETPTDIIFDCMVCTGSLAADPGDAGNSVNCPHCQELITIPFQSSFSGDEDIPGVRRLGRPGSANQAISNARYEELSEAYTQLQDELAEARAALAESKAQEAEAMEQIDKRFRDLQSQLDRTIGRLAARDKEYEQLKQAVGHLESAATEVLRHLAPKSPLP